MSHTTSAAVDIARRMDRLPVLRSHRFMTLVVGAGLFFDCYENFLAVTIAKVLERDFALSGMTLSLVLASAFIGQFIGALLLGRLADRIGRRRAFIVNLLLYCGFSLVAAFSPSAWWLIVCRFIAGVGIGGEYALADSYLSELLPARVRGRYISWAYTVSFFGVPAVGVLALWLVPLSPAGIAGWRWLFVIGALGGVLVWWVRRAVPESPRWLALHGRVDAATRIVERLEDEARRAGHVLADPAPRVYAGGPGDGGGAPGAGAAVPAGGAGVDRVGGAAGQPDRSPGAGGGGKPTFASLFRPPLRRRTVMTSLLSGLQVFGYYGFGTVATLVLTAKGFDVIHSLGYIALTYLGYPVGSALSVPIIERAERKFLVMVSAGAMAVFGVAFGLAQAPWQAVVAGLLFTVSSNVGSNAYHIYLAENFPTRVRGTAVGFAYSMSKMVAALLPFILIPLLHAAGPGPVFAVVATALVLAIILVGTLGGRTTGRGVDE
ncbi:MFS transporter [Corynebacterium bovis]|uniref:MFS transporter n=2 Tax=Corynebacterium bovis TaxID=36808 RepID=UPI0030802499